MEVQFKLRGDQTHHQYEAGVWRTSRERRTSRVRKLVRTLQILFEVYAPRLLLKSREGGGGEGAQYWSKM